MSTSYDAFLAELHRVFPIGDPASVQFSQCECDECAELRRDFQAYTWESLPASIIEKHKYSLVLLGDDAVRYYLPAFLKAALASPDADLANSVFHFLEPSGISTAEIAKFTPLQRNLIASYFDLNLEEDDLPPSARWLKKQSRWRSGHP